MTNPTSRRPGQDERRRYRSVYRPPVRLDLRPILMALDEAIDLAEQLDDKRTSVDVDTGAGRASSQERAAINHDILFLAALLRSAAADVDMVYWMLRNRRDPRPPRS